MALIRSGTAGTEVPYIYYDLYADQMSGSGTERSVKITINVKVNGSSGYYYGFPVNWRATVNGVWGGWSTLKGSESWNGGQGLRGFSQTLNVNVGTTSSKAITVGFQLDSFGGDNGWDSTTTGTFTVGSTNTAPYFPGGSSVTIREGNASGRVLTGIVPENVSRLFVNWSSAADNEGGTLRYWLQESINGGGWTTIDGGGTDREHGFDVGSGNEGQRRKYYVDCRDSGDALSGQINSIEITKNTLTHSGFTGHSNDIAYDTKSFKLLLSGGSNTDGSAVKYRCYSETVTVYNQTETSAKEQVILVWKTGESIPASNQPYIKFDDLKNHYKTSNYNGRLHVGVATKNNYGTEKKASGSIGVDIRVKPSSVGKVVITGGSAKKVIAGESVYLPNGTDNITFSWSPSSNGLGADFNYEIYKLVGISEIRIDTAPSNITSYSFIPSRENEKTQLGFMVRAITSYGFYTDVRSDLISLEYYRSPEMSIGEIVRSDTAATFPVVVDTKTSISSVVGSNTWKSSNGEEGSGNVSLKKLLPNDTYTVQVTYNDNSGLSQNAVKAISIGRNLPIVDINRYGLGVGGVTAEEQVALKVRGNTKLGGDLSVDGKIRPSSAIDKTGKGPAFTITNDTGKTMVYKADKGEHLFGGNSDGTDTITDFIRVGVNNLQYSTDGKINEIYHSGNKSGLITQEYLRNKVNLNDYKTQGEWGLYQYDNGPIETGMISHLKVKYYSDDWVIQEFTTVQPNPVKYQRSFYSGTTWTGWKDVTVYRTDFGDVSQVAQRVGNINVIAYSGWVAFSSGTAGAPCSYGTVLTIVWGSADRSQFAMNVTGPEAWIRAYMNGTWSGWRAW